MSARAALGIRDVPSRRGPAGVNDFAVTLANVNGTGSASVNSLLMHAIFRMGVPVSGKNVFPSNIQGLPTWYAIRVNEQGHTARADEPDLLVAMNPRTYAQDIERLRTGGFVLYDATWPLGRDLTRADVEFLGVPFTAVLAEAFPDAAERVLLRNVAYLGALVALLAVDVEIVTALLTERFARSEHRKVANERAFELGYRSVLDRLDCPLPFHLSPTVDEGDRILVDGNTAIALGCLWAGATVAAWYPLTPSTSVMDHFTELCERYRRVPGGSGGSEGTASERRNYLIVQAEDELAAIGVVIGAGWNGARAFTATSGPGISLMNEQLGLAYYSEIPAVVFDVQRAGPSTGMPTRTQQGDLLACAYASHGDTKHLVLFPSDPSECFDFAVRALDLAERFQTPVLVCSDLDIAMNDWVVPELAWDDHFVPDRGRVLGEADLRRIEQFFRYDDPDETFVTARTLPGVAEEGAYFTRGSGHDRHGAYTESASAYSEVVDRLARKHEAAASFVPSPVVERRDGAVVGLVALGSSDLAVREGLELLAEQGVAADYLRVRGFPFHPSVRAFLDEHERCVVVDQNRDGQLRTLLVAETGAAPQRLGSVRVYGGLPLSARQVVDGVLAALERPGERQ